MDTPLLDAIRRNRGHLDELELCILWMGDEQDASEDDLETAEHAAEELAALRRVAEAARNHDLMAGPPSNRDGECFFCGGGAMHANYCDYHKWSTELNAALAEYDKCRAA